MIPIEIQHKLEKNDGIYNWVYVSDKDYFKIKKDIDYGVLSIHKDGILYLGFTVVYGLIDFSGDMSDNKTWFYNGYQISGTKAHRLLRTEMKFIN